MLQRLKASPVYPIKQEHFGAWLTVVHSALIPQVPGQGSWHLLLIHALFPGQSESIIHSGRHPSYGFPKYPSLQVHEPTLFCSLQKAFGPHGEGEQGLKISVGVCIIHWLNGSPPKPSGHTHIAEWLTTRHSAFTPQALTHGSLHFWFTHAKCEAHSLLLIHSGLQYGGCPWYFGMQVQDGDPLISWHTELGPHGEGWHGFITIAGEPEIIKII